MDFQVTRQEIINAAMGMLGVRFLHQGRDPETGVDCMGFLVCIGRKIGYPQIVDNTTYRRMPKAELIRETILQNCDEIEVKDARPGDFYLIRLTGRKLRHAAVKLSDDLLIHAGGVGYGKVKIESISTYQTRIGAAFRVRGLID
jgi:cell wall-associated NlpC family hydrolase